MMSGAVSPLRESEVFIDMLTMFSNPIAGILVGIAVYRSTPECISDSWCTAGTFCNRYPDFCKCIPDRTWYRCRCGLSGSDLCDWSQQEW